MPPLEIEMGFRRNIVIVSNTAVIDEDVKTRPGALLGDPHWLLETLTKNLTKLLIHVRKRRSKQQVAFSGSVKIELVPIPTINIRGYP